MPKFRKKPVVIEAEQFNGDAVRGVCRLSCAGFDGDDQPHVHTIHKGQLCAVVPGDWIIPEPDGEHYYPCKPDIFEATYEPVPETVDAQPTPSMNDDPMLQFFGYIHLPPRLAAISAPFHSLAREITKELPRNPERTVALRKLLESKDCAVRSRLYIDA